MFYMEELNRLRLDIINTYKTPLIWKFNDIGYNRMFMYGYEKCDPLEETFFVFYIVYDEYFIDIGSCYEYGDFEYGRFDFYDYRFKITRQIKLDQYANICKELNTLGYIFGNCIFDWHILDKDMCIEGYKSIEKGDVAYWYEISDDFCFINYDEEIKFVTEYINIYK